MAKLIFKKYNVKLTGKDYSILVPEVDSKQFHICPYQKFYKESDNWIETDMSGLKLLRDVFAALASETEHIFYLPLKRKNPERNYGLWENQPNMVIYSHQIQLQRKLWKKLEQCMKYQKGELYTIHVDYRKLEEVCKKEWKEWQKKDSYYRRENRLPKAYYWGENTWFLECSRRIALNLAVEFHTTAARTLTSFYCEDDCEVEFYPTYLSYDFAVYAVKGRTPIQSKKTL